MPSTQSEQDEAAPSVDEVCQWGAAEIARRIQRKDVSSMEVVEAFIRRIGQVNERLNAMVWPLFDQARADAQAADAQTAADEPAGPLHGVPITLKECFHLAGTPSTIGLTRLAHQMAKEDGGVVRLLREAGAIVLGKTNVSQLMALPECDNPLYGRTKNPWNEDRTPGGSTGGEAALIACGASPLGLGGDIGGSIRIPCHWCGVQGIKPTTGRLPTRGLTMAFRGMEAIGNQPGPMARRVEDLDVALKVLSGAMVAPQDGRVAPTALSDPADVRLERTRIAYWTDDGCFPASPAVRRAVEEAAEALRGYGVVVESFEPPDVDQAMDIYMGLLSADGGADMRRLLKGSRADKNIRRMLRLSSFSAAPRSVLTGFLQATGQRRYASIIRSTGAISADRYWQLCRSREKYQVRFMEALERHGYDAMIFPPHALAATRHGHGLDLLAPCSYSMLSNLLGVPAGVVAATRVREDEESDRPKSGDRIDRLAYHNEVGSAGLPVGVQVAARHWREDVVLAVMAALEEAFRSSADYPGISLVGG